MQVSVDAGKCIGCGMCAYTAPEVFRMDGKVSTVHAQPQSRARYRVLDAQNGCPVNAISVRDTPQP